MSPWMPIPYLSSLPSAIRPRVPCACSGSERGALPEHALVALQWHAQGQTGLRMLLGTPVHRGQAYTPA